MVTPTLLLPSYPRMLLSPEPTCTDRIYVCFLFITNHKILELFRVEYCSRGLDSLCIKDLKLVLDKVQKCH